MISREIPVGTRRCQGGFTLLELVVVCLIVGVMAMVAVPAVSGAMVRTRVDQAASVVAEDFSRAFTLAGRARHPIQIAFETDDLLYRLVNQSTGEVIVERRFGSGSGYGLTSVSTSKDTVEVYPNGFAIGLDEGDEVEPLVVRVGIGDATRVITLTSTGRIRVGE